MKIKLDIISSILIFILILFNTSNLICEHFIFHKSDDSYSIIINSINISVEDNDEIGVFAKDDDDNFICSGAKVLSAGQHKKTLAAWGDDPHTTPKDGFVQDEFIQYRFWDDSEQIEYFVTVEYIRGNGSWYNDLYSEINITITIPVPVELSYFEASVFNNNVNLNWKTLSESNNYGFEIFKNFNNSIFVKIGFVNGNGTTTLPILYSFNDNDLKPGIYSYTLKQIDFNGEFKYSNVVTVNINNPNSCKLFPNYPNPFNPTTNIVFQVDKKQNVKLTIYNIEGKMILSLIDDELTPGMKNVIWDACDERCQKVPSGVYMYCIQIGNFKEAKKMLLIR